MAGPTSPSAEGPTFAPPSLPAGWIAQWDGASKKYYFVQLATGASQWDIPTEAVQTGNTPLQPVEHPYGTPQPELITHPDGSQTVKHADGTLEPILPDGSRGVEGQTGDRGIGSIAMNALLGGKNSGHGSSGHSSGGGLGGLASSFLGGGSGHSSGGKNPAGKLVGQLASSLLSPSHKPSQPQNYHGGQSSSGQHHQQGGLAGAVMGGVANMFGGKPGHGSNNGHNYGYSNTGTGDNYSGQAPTYHPPGSAGSHGSSVPPSGAAQSYHSPPPNQHQGGHNNQYPPPPSQASSHQSYQPPPGSSHQSYPPPPGSYPPPPGSAHQSYPPPPPGQPPHSQSYGAPSYPHSPAPPHSGGDPYAQGGQGYGAAPGGQQYPPPPPAGYNAQYSGGQQQYGGQPSYQGGPPPVPHGTHPHQGQGFGGQY